MIKEFLSYNTVRNDAIKLADKIYRLDGFVPDVIYCSLRGGAYMANVISEYYKLARKNERPVLFAAVVAHSYSGIKTSSSRIYVDGWTYPPQNLRQGDKIMLIDDIFDTGRTVNALVQILLDSGIARENIKVVVHDYKHFTYKPVLSVIPDYFCRKLEITKPEEDRWIHYMSHELIGLTDEELENNYYKDDPELKSVLEPLLK